MEAKARLMMKQVTADEEFVALFKGKFDVSNKGLCYRLLLNWLAEGDGMKKAMTCLVFYSKPLVFLATGKTRAKKNVNGEVVIPARGDGRPVDDKVLHFLPHLAKEQLDEMDKHPVATESAIIRRNGKFKTVNFSMVRRCALLAAEHLPAEDLVKQWIRVHGGRPMSVNLSSWDVSNETSKIRAEQILELQMDHELHEEMDWLAAFMSTPSQG
jgi:hypothetical protein